MLALIGQNSLPDWLSGLFVGGLCLIPIAWFVISILLCIWVYRDSESRGMNGALWLIIVLISGIIGLIIYLVVRKDKGTSPQGSLSKQVTRVCTKCGRAIPEDTKFCPHCGNPIPE